MQHIFEHPLSFFAGFTVFLIVFILLWKWAVWLDKQYIKRHES